MSLHFDRYWHEFRCDECGQVYDKMNNEKDPLISYVASDKVHQFFLSNGCHRCNRMEENERMAKPINKELSDVLKTFETIEEATNAATPHQPRQIGRMKLRSKITDYGTGDWSQLTFECTDCKATVEAHENTLSGVIIAWDDEYRDCPYCVTRELREADLKDLPDFGVF